MRIYVDTQELRGLAQRQQTFAAQLAELRMRASRTANAAPSGVACGMTGCSTASAQIDRLGAALAASAAALGQQAGLQEAMEHAGLQLAGLQPPALEMFGSWPPWPALVPGIGGLTTNPGLNNLLGLVDQIAGGGFSTTNGFGVPAGANPFVQWLFQPIPPSGPTIVDQLDQLALNLGVQNALAGRSSLFADGTIAQLNNTLRIGSLIPGGLTVGGQVTSALNLINQNAQLRAMGLLPPVGSSSGSSFGSFAMGFTMNHLTPRGSVGQPLIHSILPWP